MNVHDLLEAFQCVDSEFLEEAAARAQSAPPKTVRQIAASLLEKKEDNMSNNKLWQGLMGAAAMVAVFSIMAAGVAAVKPDSGMAAKQPEDSVLTDMSESAEMTDTADTTAADSAEEAETTTETTGLQLPSDEFVEETLPPKKEEPPIPEEVLAHYAYSNAVSNLQFEIVSEGVEYPEIIELGEPNEKIHIQLKTYLLYDEWYDCRLDQTVDARIVLMQNGEILPFALRENGEFALWQDMTASLNGDVFVADLWLVPSHREEYSQLNVTVVFNPDYHDDWTIVKVSNKYQTVTLHTAAPVQEDSTELPYAVASAEDYVDFPAQLLGYRTSSWDGIGMGRIMDYNANVPNRHSVSYSFEHSARRDAFYVKLHRNTEEILETYSDNPEVMASCLEMKGMYVLLLCDGKPFGAFDGKNVLYIDVPTAEKTLNYRVTLDDSVTDGVHNFTVIAFGIWEQPYQNYIDSHSYQTNNWLEIE